MIGEDVVLAAALQPEATDWMVMSGGKNEFLYLGYTGLLLLTLYYLVTSWEDDSQKQMIINLSLTSFDQTSSSNVMNIMLGCWVLTLTGDILFPCSVTDF